MKRDFHIEHLVGERLVGKSMTRCKISQNRKKKEVYLMYGAIENW